MEISPGWDCGCGIASHLIVGTSGWKLQVRLLLRPLRNSPDNLRQRQRPGHLKCCCRPVPISTILATVLQALPSCRMPLKSCTSRATLARKFRSLDRSKISVGRRIEGRRLLLRLTSLGLILKFPNFRGTVFCGPYNQDPASLGAKLGSPTFGNSHKGTD